MLLTEVKKHKSTCSYCGVGCGILISTDNRGRLQVEGDPDHPVNKGMLCSKGRTLNYVVDDRSDRLLYPEMRWNKQSPRTRVSWNSALDRTAAVFKSLISSFGPDSVGFYVSGQLLTEEYYVVNKLTKGFLGTNNIDTNSRLCMSSAVVGYKLSLGEDAVPVSYEDIELADCFFITGANPAWCHPILFRRLEKHKNDNPDIKIIVADPRRTQSASTADLHLQLMPGTDIYLNHAIARWLIEHDAIDKSFIENHSNGFDAFREQVMKLSIAEYATICDLKAEDIELAAKWISEAKGFISMWAMGLNQSVVGVNKNLSLINLSLITGKIGKPGNGPFSLTGQPNAMGGREVGGLCNLLPAHRNMENPAHRDEVAHFWGVPSVPAKPGYTATQMFEALADDRMKAIWIMCTNPLVSLPNARLAEEALKKARFVVVQDISNSTLSMEYADVVLPAAGWAEKEGTMTNSDRRISYLNKVLDPPGEAIADAQIICNFAKKMQFHGFDFNTNSDIFDEHARLTKGTNIDISGLSYNTLIQNGTAQWPFPSDALNGTARLFTNHKFYTPDLKAIIHTTAPDNLSEPVTPELPLILTTGRIRDQWHTMTKTGKVSRLKKHIDNPFVEINPKDADKYNIIDNCIVEINTKYGNLLVNAKITDEIKAGVIFTPMHWGKINGSDLIRSNNLTSPLVDARSKEPDFKYTAASIIKYEKGPEKIIVVGAGAAAFKFITTLRQLGSKDEIHVFSDEPHPFYNRVLLPDYITGSRSWEQLQKINEQELTELNIHLHVSTRISLIDKVKKTVTDSHNQLHSYDKLILATGSRPVVPTNFDKTQIGLFTVRSRHDAEQIMKHLSKGDMVTLIGAGVLSLEMAASLIENQIRVCMISRSGSIMNRQLDKLSAEMLREIIEEHGTKIYANDEVETILRKEDDKIVVLLRSGHKIECKSVIAAIGTIPNTELAKQSGLKVQRGVVVNNYMQTSDPNIYAMGEIAEHNDLLYGITMVAEEQAESAAQYLCGNISGAFTGSVSINILKYPGLELCSIGITEIPDNDKSYEEIIFADRASRYYKKCIIRNNIMVGAILFGDKLEFAEFKDLIKQKTELSEMRLTLLRSGKPTKPILGRVVCSCNNVGEGNIIGEIKNNTTDFEKLCLITGAGTGCGSCKPEVKIILKKQLIAQ